MISKDTNGSKSALDRTSLPNWLYLYFILAGCLLFVLSASLYFNHRILGLQAKSLRFNREWTQRGLRYAELGRLAAAVNLPGNDVFESNDPEAESAKLYASVQSFQHAWGTARDDLNANVAADVAAPLLEGLDLLKVRLEKMAAEGELVFEFFVSAKDKSGARMAAMDREFSEVRAARYVIEQCVSRIQQKSFDEQETEALALTNWEYALDGLIVILVGGVLAYAVLLSRQITRAANVADHNLALLHESEQALRNQTIAAEKANVAKSTFLANMSHEIRTPMTAIMGYTEMLLEPDRSQSEVTEAVQIVRRSAGHLLTLIDDVLDISKIEAEKMTVERVATDIPQIAADVVSLLRPSATAKGMRCRLTFGDSVARSIRSDPVRVKQVLMNLVGNALKFTEQGEVHLHVSSIVRDNEIVAVFEVTDSGIGMSAEQVERIFQPFTQADDSTTRKFGGTGLGLTISKRLAELLGGELTVESLPGVGSKFSFTVDGGSADGVDLLHGFTESLLSVSRQRADDHPISLFVRILLAEDGIDNQRLISMHLRKAGAEVTIADNGRIAVDLAETEPFDLILMDMQMPELDGYAATRELRSRGYTLPIIALTAHAMAEDRGRCLAAGCDDFLTKPIAKNVLLTAIATYLADEGSNAGPLPTLTPVEQPTPCPSPTSSFADDPEMKEAIQDFVGTLPMRIAAIGRLQNEHHRVEFRRLIHQLRGAGGGYGFDHVTQLAAEVEHAFEPGEPPDAIQIALDALIAHVRSLEGYQHAHEAANV